MENWLCLMRQVERIFGTDEGHKQARYFAFDLLWLNREDLRRLPLLIRKEKVKRILSSRSM
jgi:ATP-dependent DNA ligase